MTPTEAAFRRLYGDELADQIEAIKNQPTAQIWAPPPRRREAPAKAEQLPDKPSEQTEDSDNPNWWER